MLQLAWKPDISGRPAASSTVTACVFIETSSVPWNAPHANSAANSAAKRACQPDERAGQAVAQQADLAPCACCRAWAAAARTISIAVTEPSGRAEEGEAERAVGQPEVVLDLRDVRRPGGEQQAVADERGQGRRTLGPVRAAVAALR